MEAHVFSDTIAMSSLALREATNRKLKVRVCGSGWHQPAMLFQRMGGRLIGGRPSWKRMKEKCEWSVGISNVKLW